MRVFVCVVFAGLFLLFVCSMCLVVCFCDLMCGGVFCLCLCVGACVF